MYIWILSIVTRGPSLLQTFRMATRFRTKNKTKKKIPVRGCYQKPKIRIMQCRGKFKWCTPAFQIHINMTIHTMSCIDDIFGVYCVLFHVLSYIMYTVACSWMYVLFYYSFVCFPVYAYDPKSIAGAWVTPRRDSTDHPIPANHTYAFLMFG